MVRKHSRGQADLDPDSVELWMLTREARDRIEGVCPDQTDEATQDPERRTLRENTPTEPLVNLVGQTSPIGWTDVTLPDSVDDTSEFALLFVEFEATWDPSEFVSPGVGELCIRCKGHADTDQENKYRIYVTSGNMLANDGGCCVEVDSNLKFQYKVDWSGTLPGSTFNLRILLRAGGRPTTPHSHTLGSETTLTP